MATEMKRITISVPDDLDKAIANLRQTPKFAKCSYTEVIRQLLALGLSKGRN